MSSGEQWPLIQLGLEKTQSIITSPKQTPFPDARPPHMGGAKDSPGLCQSVSGQISSPLPSLSRKSSSRPRLPSPPLFRPLVWGYHLPGWSHYFSSGPPGNRENQSWVNRKQLDLNKMPTYTESEPEGFPDEGMWLKDRGRGGEMVKDFIFFSLVLKKKIKLWRLLNG